MGDVFIRRGNYLDIEISDDSIGVFQERGGRMESIYFDDLEDANVLAEILRRYAERQYAKEAAKGPPADYDVNGS